MSKLSSRMDKLEKVARKEHVIQRVSIKRWSGKEGKKAERMYLIHQAEASLGYCEPSAVIFLSRRLKELREEYPRFPYGLPEEQAKRIIEECQKENEAA